MQLAVKVGRRRDHRPAAVQDRFLRARIALCRRSAASSPASTCGREPPPASEGPRRRADRRRRSCTLFPNLKERMHSQGPTALRRRAADAGHRAASCAPSARICLLRQSRPRLAPVIVQQIGNAIRKLKSRRASPSCWSEQNLQVRARTVADRHYVMEPRARSWTRSPTPHSRRTWIEAASSISVSRRDLKP